MGLWPRIKGKAEVKAVSKAEEEFSKSLYEVIKKSAKKDNILLSPYSVMVVLAMLSEGARGETHTNCYLHRE